MADADGRKATPKDRAEIRSRPDRFFVDDASGTLHRFQYRDGSNAVFDVTSRAWVPDPSAAALDFMMRGGYKTEITADEVASIVTGEVEGLALLATTQPRRPYL